MCEEERFVERLGKEIRRIRFGGDERHAQLKCLDHVANEEVHPSLAARATPDPCSARATGTRDRPLAIGRDLWVRRVVCAV